MGGEDRSYFNEKRASFLSRTMIVKLIFYYVHRDLGLWPTESGYRQLFANTCGYIVMLNNLWVPLWIVERSRRVSKRYAGPHTRVFLWPFFFFLLSITLSSLPAATRTICLHYSINFNITWPPELPVYPIPPTCKILRDPLRRQRRSSRPSRPCVWGLPAKRLLCIFYRFHRMREWKIEKYKKRNGLYNHSTNRTHHMHCRKSYGRWRRSSFPRKLSRKRIIKVFNRFSNDVVVL